MSPEYESESRGSRARLARESVVQREGVLRVGIAVLARLEAEQGAKREPRQPVHVSRPAPTESALIRPTSRS